VLPRSSSRGSGIPLRCVPVLTVVMACVLSACSREGTPAPTPLPRPSQPQAAVATPAVATPAVAAPAPKPVAPPFVYEAKGRRDPFRPLIAPRLVETKSRPKTGLAALEVNELKLAGIIWEQRGYFALVEAPNGSGYVLRVNDTVGGEARVTRITPEAVTFEVGAGMRGGPTPSQLAKTRVVELRLRKEE
jgi:Tfp pilus assembly protein PilP